MSWGMRQWTEREIREIVREEMADEKLVAMTEKAQRDCYEQTKPKTDLERAAEIADSESRRDLDSTPEYVVGYYHAARTIHEGIRTLSPSPDWEAQATRWRKIAEGLREAISGSGDGRGSRLFKALDAYDAAVKEQP